MIAYLKGKLAYNSPAKVIIEAGGVGYELQISLNTFSTVQHVEDGGSCKLHTYYHITENAHTLYGFADVAEKELFAKLISVSGIGPSLARMALSSLTPSELKEAIAQGNVATIQRVKGIGAKSAQRIVLELRDKIGEVTESENIVTGPNNTNSEEALSALVALGFSKTIAEKAINRVLQSGEEVTGVETLVKKSLKAL